MAVCINISDYYIHVARKERMIKNCMIKSEEHSCRYHSVRLGQRMPILLSVQPMIDFINMWLDTGFATLVELYCHTDKNTTTTTTTTTTNNNNKIRATLFSRLEKRS